MNEVKKILQNLYDTLIEDDFTDRYSNDYIPPWVHQEIKRALDILNSTPPKHTSKLEKEHDITMMIRINPCTIHNLQTVATYTTADEPMHMGKNDSEMVVRCNGDVIARGQSAIDFWGVLVSMVNKDLVKTRQLEIAE